jgi:hypothetical protein
MTRSETIRLSEEDIREAIIQWWQSKSPCPIGLHTLTLHYNISTSGTGWAEIDKETYTATIIRDIPPAPPIESEH